MQFGMFTFKAVYVNKIEIIGWYGLDFSLELISLFFQSMLFTESIPYFNFHQNCSNLLPPSKLPKTGFEPRILGFLVEEVTTHPTVPNHRPPVLQLKCSTVSRTWKNFYRDKNLNLSQIEENLIVLLWIVLNVFELLGECGRLPRWLVYCS